MSANKIKQFAKEIKTGPIFKPREYILVGDEPNCKVDWEATCENRIKLLALSTDNITQLCDMLLDAVEALEFYGKGLNGGSFEIKRPEGVFISNDSDERDFHGARARETLSKLAEGLR